ncbi:MAG: UTP--glucose-1-phosphate uridylyltransferase, partial [Terriglobales bacterium]
LQDAPSDLAVVGRYLLTPGIFKHLRHIGRGAGGEIQLTDAMRALAQEEPFYAYQFQGRRHDTGDKLGFLQATVELALQREDLGAAFRQYLHSLPL